MDKEDYTTALGCRVVTEHHFRAGYLWEDIILSVPHAVKAKQADRQKVWEHGK